MPARLSDLAPGAIGVLRWIAKEEVRIDLVPADVAGFLNVLKARGLIEYGEDAGMFSVVRLTPDGHRLFEDGRF